MKIGLETNEHLNRAKKETMESKLRSLMIEKRELLLNPLIFFGKLRGRSSAGVDGRTSWLWDRRNVSSSYIKYEG